MGELFINYAREDRTPARRPRLAGVCWVLFLTILEVPSWCHPGIARAKVVVSHDFSEQVLPCHHASHGLGLTDSKIVTLLSDSIGDRCLAWRSREPSAELHYEKLQGAPDGFQASGSRLLLWTHSADARGRLALLDLREGARKTIFEGPVLRLGEPALRDGNVWWVTTTDGAVRIAFLASSWEEGATPVYRSPELPAPVTKLVFTSHHAVLSSASSGQIWRWRPGEPAQAAESWQPLPDPEGYEIVDACGDAVLGFAADRRLFRLDLGSDDPRWTALPYRTETGRSPYDRSFRSTPDARGLVLAERSDAMESGLEESRAWLVHVAFDGAETTRREVSPSLLKAPATESWTWDGSFFAAVRYEGGELKLLSGSTEEPSRRSTRNPVTVDPTARGPETVGRTSEPTLPPATNREPSGEPRDLALGWLKNQLRPSLSQRSTAAPLLIDSYEDDNSAGWIYDAALAAVAFTAAGETDLARRLLLGLEALQEDQGSWIFSYDPERARPLGTRRYPGSMAWVVMAANFYEWETRDRRFADMARRGLDYLARLRQDDPEAETYGGISMGQANPEGYSTEHNLDGYSAFYWRSRLEEDERRRSSYSEVARGIREFVLRELWSDSEPRYFKVGYRDNVLFLDAQSWSVLALWDGVSAPARVQAALSTAEERLRRTDGRLGQTTGIVGFNESEVSVISDKVWAEGSEGVVAALYALGSVERAREYHSQTARYQTPTGGIPYATENADAFPTVPAVASTAWFLLNELSPPRNPFQPGPMDVTY